MSDSIADVLAKAKLLSVETSEFQSRVSSNDEEIRQKIADLTTRIKAGESTGDAINDFVVVRHHVLPSMNPTYVEVYRNLDARLKAHPGQFLLLVERSEQDLYHTISHDDSTPRHVKEELKLGLLGNPSGLRFDLETGTAFFRTIRFSDGNTVTEGELTTSGHNGDIPLMHNQGVLDTGPLAWTGSRRREIALEIFIGDDEVKYCADDLPYIGAFWRMTKLLSRDLELPRLTAWLSRQQESEKQTLLRVLQQVSELRLQARQILESKRDSIEGVGLDFEQTVKTVASEHDIDL